MRRWQRGDVPKDTLLHCLLFLPHTLPHSLPSCPTCCTQPAQAAPPGPCPNAPHTLPHTAQPWHLMWMAGSAPLSPWQGLQHPVGLKGSQAGEQQQQQGPHEPVSPPSPFRASVSPSPQLYQHLVSMQVAGAGDGAINDAN